jgi:NADPH:quinone reductase-like Zn-dependent oxidoreductase
LLATLGFEPVAITRRGSEHEGYLKALGAVDIRAAEVDEPSSPLQKTLWGGVIDNVGGSLLAQLIAQTGLWGNVASIGLAGSAKLPATVLPFILRGVNLLGVHSVEWPMPPRRQLWAKIFGDWQLDHQLWLRHEVPLENIMPVCEAMLAGQHDGRAVVLCTADAT